MLNKIRKNKLIISFLVILTGTAGAQAITLLLMPMITRLYGPEIFGLLGSFNSFLAILLPLAALSYPMAIILPSKDEHAFQLAKSSITISFLSAIVISVIILAFIEMLNMVTTWGNDRYLYVLMIVALLLSVFLEVLSYLILRFGYFKSKSKALILHSLILNVTKLLVGYFYPTALALIGVTVIGIGLHSFLIYCFAKNIFKVEKPFFYLGILKKYKDFPRFRALQTCVANINQAAPIFLLTTLFGIEYAGYFVLCRTVMLAPVTLVAKSVNDALMPNLAEKIRNKENVASLILKSTAMLAFIAFIPSIVFFFFGMELFQFIFGNEWSKAGEYASWFTLWMFFNFINRPSISAVPALNLEKKLLLNSVANTFLAFGGFYFGYVFFENDVDSIILYSILGIIPQLYILLFVYFKAKEVK
ncbi:MAG: O-antigen/teichoic acid export membrane protein [Psychroserpens sp.]